MSRLVKRVYIEENRSSFEIDIPKSTYVRLCDLCVVGTKPGKFIYVTLDDAVLTSLNSIQRPLLGSFPVTQDFAILGSGPITKLLPLKIHPKKSMFRLLYLTDEVQYTKITVSCRLDFFI